MRFFGGRLSETLIDLAVMKRRMIESASRVVVLADSTKFSHPAFCDVANVTQIDAIVTDARIDESQKEALAGADVGVIVVDPDQPVPRPAG